MNHSMSLFLAGAITIVGGIALIKWGWADRMEEGRSNSYLENSSFADFDFRIGHLSTGCGWLLVIFGTYCIWGGSQGWTAEHVIKSAFGYFKINASSYF